jgi:predicted RNA-binding protein with PIN domain
MIVNGDKIPDWVMQEFAHLIKNADEAIILDLARASPSLRKGFRKDRISVTVVRKRLLSDFKAEHELSDHMRALLVDLSSLAQSFQTLSARSIQNCWKPLLSLFAVDAVTAALLDSRDAVRALTAESLSRDVPPEATADSEAARNQVMGMARQFFIGFEDILSSKDSETPDDAAPPEGEPPTEHDDKLRLRISELEEQLGQHRTRSSQLKAVESKLANQEKRTQELGQERDRLIGECKALEEGNSAYEERINRMTNSLDAAANARAQLLEQQAKAVKEGVASELATINSRWISRLTAVDSMANNLPDGESGDDVLVEAEAVLARQREVDLASGRLSELRARHRALEEAEAAIDAAITDAVHPLPDLAEIRQKIESEADRILKVIEPGGVKLAETAARVACIAQYADDWDALDDLKSLIETLRCHDLLSPEESRSLYALHWTKMSRLYADRDPKVITSARETQSDPMTRILARTVTDAARVMLALDGYNVILGIPEVFGPVLTEGRPSQKARDTLISEIDSLFAKHENWDVRIFFDSPEWSQTRHGPNVMSVFSGGSGDHRADKVILEELHTYGNLHGVSSLLLVTNDRDLQKQARAEGAGIISTDEFAAVLLKT